MSNESSSINPRVAKRLHDVLVTAQEVNQLVEEHTLDSFLKDFRTRLLMQKLLEIMGEALAQASRQEPSLEQEIAGLRKCVDMRNRMVHGYASVDYTAVWDTARLDVPTLAASVATLMMNEPLDPSVTMDSWFNE